MRCHRYFYVISAVALLLGGLLLRAPEARAVGAWTPTAPRTPVRDDVFGVPATATTLADGRVLVTGAYYSSPEGRPGGAAELYDPAADRWTATAPFDPNGGRATPTLLPDGRVLFVGGVALRGASPSSMVGLETAQVYDPVAGTWTAIAPMRVARRDHTATPLPDGTVLVVSGDSGSPLYAPRPTAGVERYDPGTGRWAEAAPLARARFGHGAALLRDGRVLVFGGYGDPTAEVYDPAANRWTPAASLPWGRRYDYSQRALVLDDGRVLALGLGGYDRSPAAAVYDPATDRWAPAPPPPAGMRAASPLPGGRVLVAGPDTGIYDPARNAWAGAAPPADPGALGADPAANPATPLRDGRVLLVGQRGAEIYTDDPAPRACFPETGQCASGRFLEYWLAHGGLARNGFPLTGVRIEVLEDGRAYQVQYFERVRMELHPENQPPFDVLLGQFGRRILLEDYVVDRARYPYDVAPVAPKEGQAYFAETGHNISPRFRDYWVANGGLAQFGFPITEERWDTLTTGARPCCVTQYFERARFEWHPENAGTPYEVLLGQFGRRILDENALLTGAFGQLFQSDERVRGLLGRPTGPAVRSAGALQPFERGLMLYQGDQRRIYVFCGERQSGMLVASGQYPTEPQFPYFLDTWQEGQDPGGGPGPGPGLFLPQRGFGKVWRENPLSVRGCLGYATAASETGYTIAVQPFAGGLMLTDPEGGIYVVNTFFGKCCGLGGRYERFPAR